MKEIIKLENIKRDFKVGDETVHALRGVSFTIYEGEELVVDLEASFAAPVAEAETERSPFMPGPPGSNKNKKNAK